MPRQKVLTRSEAQQWETKQFQKPRTSASLSPKELNAQRKASGQSTKPKSQAKLTQAERASFETKEFKKPLTEASRPKPMGSLVEGEARMASQRAASQAGKGVAKRMAGRALSAVAGPVAGAVGAGLLLGEALKGTRPARAAAEGLTNLMAKATGLEARQNKMLSSKSDSLPKPKGRVTGDSPTMVPSKDLKMLSSAPKPPTPEGSTSPARKSAPKPSQKATGASRERMSGATQAMQVLGRGKDALSSDNAVMRRLAQIAMENSRKKK